MRTTNGTGMAGVQVQDNVHGVPARATVWPAINDSCPEDCHYCSGPETD